MPIMGGFEATENIRKYEKEQQLSRTPIVALTAHAMVGDREMCLAHQMDVSIGVSVWSFSCILTPAGIPLQTPQAESAHPNNSQMRHHGGRHARAEEQIQTSTNPRGRSSCSQEESCKSATSGSGAQRIHGSRTAD